MQCDEFPCHRDDGVWFANQSIFDVDGDTKP